MIMKDLESEVLRLRGRISTLMDEARHNEKILKQYRQRELDLLNAEDLPSLFDAICNRLQISYGLQSVVLVLRDPQRELRHLILGNKIRLQDYPRVIFYEKSDDELSSWFGSSVYPWLGSYSKLRHQDFFKKTTDIKSVALIPLWRGKTLAGVICFGSQDETRFTRNLATDFLEHLGAMASFALENTINRARLVLSGVTDSLTGWHNRRYLQERLKQELARGIRVKSSLACIVMDLDFFKTVNDTYGHLAGDAALCEAARRIKQQIRDSDSAARFGGDEFVVLAPDISESQALHLANRIRAAVSESPIEIAEGVQYQFSVSIGVAVLPLATVMNRNTEALALRLFTEADSALLQAKQKGRDQVGLIVVSGV